MIESGWQLRREEIRLLCRNGDFRPISDSDRMGLAGLPEDAVQLAVPLKIGQSEALVFVGSPEDATMESSTLELRFVFLSVDGDLEGELRTTWQSATRFAFLVAYLSTFRSLAKLKASFRDMVIL